MLRTVYLPYTLSTKRFEMAKCARSSAAGTKHRVPHRIWVYAHLKQNASLQKKRLLSKTKTRTRRKHVSTKSKRHDFETIFLGYNDNTRHNKQRKRTNKQYTKDLLTNTKKIHPCKKSGGNPNQLTVTVNPKQPLGLQLVDYQHLTKLYRIGSGLFIEKILAGDNQASLAGVKVGDQIIQVDGTDCNTILDLKTKKDQANNTTMQLTLSRKHTSPIAMYHLGNQYQKHIDTLTNAAENFWKVLLKWFSIPHNPALSKFANTIMQDFNTRYHNTLGGITNHRPLLTIGQFLVAGLIQSQCLVGVNQTRDLEYVHSLTGLNQSLIDCNKWDWIGAGCGGEGPFKEMSIYQTAVRLYYTVIDGNDALNRILDSLNPNQKTAFYHWFDQNQHLLKENYMQILVFARKHTTDMTHTHIMTGLNTNDSTSVQYLRIIYDCDPQQNNEYSEKSTSLKRTTEFIIHKLKQAAS